MSYLDKAEEIVKNLSKSELQPKSHLYKPDGEMYQKILRLKTARALKNGKNTFYKDIINEAIEKGLEALEKEMRI